MKTARRIGLSLLVMLGLAIAAFLIYVNIETGVLHDASHVEAALSSLEPRAVKVDGVKLYKQPDGYTCTVTTISVVASFGNKKDIPPEALIAKYGPTAGMSYARFVEILSAELPDYQVTIQHDQSDSETIQAIHGQLKRGLPVPIFFGAENPYNKPYFDFHASAVTGLDLTNGKVDIANVYGYDEHISLVEFLNRLSYRSTSDYPLVQRSVLKLGLKNRNSVILLTRK